MKSFVHEKAPKMSSIVLADFVDTLQTAVTTTTAALNSQTETISRKLSHSIQRGEQFIQNLKVPQGQASRTQESPRKHRPVRSENRSHSPPSRDIQQKLSALETALIEEPHQRAQARTDSEAGARHADTDEHDELLAKVAELQSRNSMLLLENAKKEMRLEEATRCVKTIQADVHRLEAQIERLMLEKEEATERCNVLQSMLDQTAKHEGIPGSSQPKLENRFSDVTLRESISVSPSGHSDLASGLVQSAEPPKLFKPSSTPRPKRSSSISQNISEIYAIGKELFGRREGIPPSQHSPLERALVETHSLEPGASPLQQPIPTSAESAHRSTPQPLLQRKLSIGNLLGMMPGVNATAEDAGTDHHNSSTRAPRRLGGPGDQAFVRSVDHGGEDGVAARGSVGSFFGGKQFKFKAKGAKVPASSATLLAEAAVEEPLTDAHSVDDVTPVEWTSYQPNKIRGTPTKCFE